MEAQNDAGSPQSSELSQQTIIDDAQDSSNPPKTSHPATQSIAEVEDGIIGLQTPAQEGMVIREGQTAPDSVQTPTNPGQTLPAIQSSQLTKRQISAEQRAIMSAFSEKELAILRPHAGALEGPPREDFDDFVEGAANETEILTRLMKDRTTLEVITCWIKLSRKEPLQSLPSRTKPGLTLKLQMRELTQVQTPYTKDIGRSIIRIMDRNKQGELGYYALYAEIYKFVDLVERALDPIERSMELITSEETVRLSINQNHTHWMENFVGDLPNALLERLVHWHSQEIYSRFMPIMNSSGVGKSKCVDQLGTIGPLVISVVLRSGDDGGYPPGDPEVLEFLSRISDLEELYQTNVLVLAFVEGTFNAVKTWATENKVVRICDSGERLELADGYDFAKVAKLWRDEMTPIRVDSLGKRSRFPNNNLEKLSEVIANSRSEHKKAFIRNLVSFANASFNELNKKELWHPNMDFSSEAVVKERISKAGEFIDALLPAAQRDDNKFIVFSIDEAGALFDSHLQNDSVSPDQGILYYNIRRVFRAMLGYPVWCIPLSTKSNIANLMPPKLQDPSMRVHTQDMLRVTPFTIFPMDVKMRESLKCKPTIELQKSLGDFAYLSHVKSMGRILWDRFSDGMEPSAVNDFVLRKLLSTKATRFRQNVRAPIDKTSKEVIRQCFAVMASRISLDEFSSTFEASELVKHSILSHLRLIKVFDPITGTAVSITPSEPIVAQAVSSMLMSYQLWPHVINVVSTKLFYPGLVSKGTKGEFYVLLLFVLARDQSLQPFMSSALSPVFSRVSPTSPPPVASSKMMAAGHFTLKSLLENLLHHSYFSDIWNAKKEGSTSQQTMGDAFKNAKLNYSHWTSASEHLYGDKEAKPTAHGDYIKQQRHLLEKLELLHLMLYRQAGLIAAVNQPDWDAVLTMYLGDDDEPVDYTQLSCLFIQTKNVKNGFAPTRDKATGNYNTNFSHFPIDPKIPVLGLIFNIGYEGPICIKQYKHEAHNVWLFDIRGTGSGMFKCIEEESLSAACKGLRDVLIPDSELTDALQKMADTYEPFSRITFAGQAGNADELRA